MGQRDAPVMRAAEGAIAAQRFDLALALLAQVDEAADPATRAEAKLLVGKAHAQAGRLGAARSAFEAGLAVAPGHAGLAAAVVRVRVLEERGRRSAQMMARQPSLLVGLAVLLVVLTVAWPWVHFDTRLASLAEAQREGTERTNATLLGALERVEGWVHVLEERFEAREAEHVEHLTRVDEHVRRLESAGERRSTALEHLAQATTKGHRRALWRLGQLRRQIEQLRKETAARVEPTVSSGLQ